MAAVESLAKAFLRRGGAEREALCLFGGHDMASQRMGAGGWGGAAALGREAPSEGVLEGLKSQDGRPRGDGVPRQCF